VKTKFQIFLAVVLAFSAVATANDSTPTLTVQAAFAFLENNQSQDFISLLSGQALSTYGNADGIVALQRALDGLTLQLVTPTFLASLNGAQAWSVSLATQTSPENLVLTAQVLCQAQSCSIVSIFLD
jgi:hypothetical protein